MLQKCLIFCVHYGILNYNYIISRGVIKVAADAPIRVVELFAGVGGFRVGLERNFGDKSFCSNEDIATVIDQVPKHDLLVGGFPCQDYSVASTGAKGFEG